MSVNSEVVEFKAGDVIVNEGEHSSDIFILVSGTVAIFKGTRKIAEVDSSDELLGEMSFFLGEKRSATMIAMTKVELQRLTHNQLQSFFSDNPDFAIKVAAALTRKLNETNKQVLSLRQYKDYYTQILRYSQHNPELHNILNQIEKANDQRENKVKDLLNQQSILSQKIISPFIEQTLVSINNFLSTDTVKGEPFEFDSRDIDMDAASIVDIMGDCRGWYVMAFPKDSALNMTKTMTQLNYTDLNEDVVGFIKEVNNIIIGNIIAAIKEYRLNISTPTTVFGASSLKNMIGKTPCIVIPFKSSLGNFNTIIYIEIMK